MILKILVSGWTKAGVRMETVEVMDGYPAGPDRSGPLVTSCRQGTGGEKIIDEVGDVGNVDPGRSVDIPFFATTGRGATTE